MTIQRLFTGQTPVNLNSDEATAVMLATGHQFKIPGN